MSGGWTMWLRTAVIAMLISVGVAIWSVLRARETDPLPMMEESPAAGQVDPPGRRARPRANIAAAVEADPFHPERRRPDEPYRFPGEIAPAQASAAQRAQQLRLIGTVASVGGGGFVFCQIGSQTPQIIHVGQQIGTYTLKSVEAGRAVFTGPSGNTLELTISQPTQSTQVNR
jgi:hypothetical protein